MNKWVLITVMTILFAGYAYSNSSVLSIQNGSKAFPEATDPYSSEQAAQNGDIVQVHGKFMNLDRWEEFLEHVNNEEADQVRLTQYTIEGDPIFYELVYDGEYIKFTYDNAMDAFGLDQGRPSSRCLGVGIKNNEQGQEYYGLTECENDTGDMFWFPKK